MAIIKHLLVIVCILFPIASIGHAIYAPNDIPLLDNRFRIDPEADQVTFIFNHREGHQRVILVKPDGSKLYQQRHPDSVAWASSKTQDIVTIKNPMAGPWQAIAKLDGDNRIKIISDVQLKVNQLPLKLYAKEYITTHATLYFDEEIVNNPSYLADAKLSISLHGAADKKMSLFQDDGRHYDELAFDGKLTAHLYVDLMPGRYLLQIRAKNDVFMRNVNKDAVVFLTPISLDVNALEVGSDQAVITFTPDDSEIDPLSVSIDGVIKNSDNKVVKQIIMHSADNLSAAGTFSSTFKLTHDQYIFSGKAFATTLDGREIELQLSDKVFELIPPFIMPDLNLSEAITTENITPSIEIAPPTSLLGNIWVIIAISFTLLLVIAGGVFFILKIKRKKQNANEDVADELSLDELQPMPIDLKDGK